MGEEDEDPDWLTAFQVPSRVGVSLLPAWLNLGLVAAVGDSLSL
jgi:hypothetical protein